MRARCLEMASQRERVLLLHNAVDDVCLLSSTSYTHHDAHKRERAGEKNEHSFSRFVLPRLHNHAHFGANNTYKCYVYHNLSIQRSRFFFVCFFPFFSSSSFCFSGSVGCLRICEMRYRCSMYIWNHFFFFFFSFALLSFCCVLRVRTLENVILFLNIIDAHAQKHTYRLNGIQKSTLCLFFDSALRTLSLSFSLSHTLSLSLSTRRSFPHPRARPPARYLAFHFCVIQLYLRHTQCVVLFDVAIVSFLITFNSCLYTFLRSLSWRNDFTGNIVCAWRSDHEKKYHSEAMNTRRRLWKHRQFQITI